jgi:hypothetical protein
VHEKSNQTNMSQKEEPEPWKNSEAKKTLQKDIIDGFVPSSWSAKEVYNDARGGRKALYAPYDFKNFSTNLRNLRKSISELQGLAIEDGVALERQLLLYPPSNVDPRGYPRWDNSQAKASLEKDVDEILAGTLERKKPAVMHASREEYLLFPLTVFRNHFYKEISDRNESTYWELWKLERKQQKKTTTKKK